jgi:hypothetical protein
MAQESTATVIDSIKLMCPDFGRMVQELTVTLNFTEPADRTQIGVPVGPQQQSLAFKFTEELVKELHNFESSLKSVTINVRVLQTNENYSPRRRLCSFFRFFFFSHTFARNISSLGRPVIMARGDALNLILEVSEPERHRATTMATGADYPYFL